MPLPRTPTETSDATEHDSMEQLIEHIDVPAPMVSVDFRNEFKRKMCDIQNEFKRQMQVMQELLISNSQQLRAEIRQSQQTQQSARQPLNETTPDPLPAQNVMRLHTSESNQTMSGRQKKIYPLPIFEGAPEDWSTFYEAFESTTHEFEYSNLHNIMRLKASLKGKAKETVEALLSSSANVSSIIDILKETFGRPE